ncbi:MAG: DUF3616 domain-containing protein, partial [Planctomycetota bacterium]
MKRTHGIIAGIPVSLRVVLLLASLLPGPVCAYARSPSPAERGRRPEWTRIDFLGRFAFDGNVLEDEDLSGIACVSPTRGLIGADERGAVQVVELSRSNRSLKVLRTVALVNADEELDIEAIACEGAFYYIVGSHGVAKKSGLRQVGRYRVFRLRVDPITGMPDDGGKALAVASLSGILAADPTLGKYFGKPLQNKGLNIEGLAVRKGRLYVGLRNPNLAGRAFVVEVPADDLFAGAGPPVYRLHKLMLGRGLGIREMVAGRSGFLIIAGNAGSEPSDRHPRAKDYDKNRGFWIFDWDGEDTDVHKIGRIPNPPGKAEAMTILEEFADGLTVLILFDGAPRGRP